MPHYDSRGKILALIDAYRAALRIQIETLDAAKGYVLDDEFHPGTLLALFAQVTSQGEALRSGGVEIGARNGIVLQAAVDFDFPERLSYLASVKMVTPDDLVTFYKAFVDEYLGWASRSPLDLYALLDLLRVEPMGGDLWEATSRNIVSARDSAAEPFEKNCAALFLSLVFAMKHLQAGTPPAKDMVREFIERALTLVIQHVKDPAVLAEILDEMADFVTGLYRGKEVGR